MDMPIWEVYTLAELYASSLVHAYASAVKT